MRRCKIKERQVASAIGYDPRDAGPRLLVRGRGPGAERIVSLAREAGVQVVEDPSLAVLLDAGGREGDIIPVWCWEAAAKAIAFVRNRAGKADRSQSKMERHEESGQSGD
ncbi:MAG: EscU/YscU/HrcU family type III secretion system export apparatus switch protein [Treponema sp.]|jgi:flagellar biosynthesis protein|nr:EscU/YscU/HrcU family type III secretion system export apparatus switch protein [Treponema sp.]